MPARQRLLFPDPQPLVDRLGSRFFRSAPTTPGVYLMRDAADTILYVGKAKNLRQRLSHYRVANPDRMPSRHLRLLRTVIRIEWEQYPSEARALQREAELLRTVQPRFNRAGTWPAPPRFLAWRWSSDQLDLQVVEKTIDTWCHHGPCGRRAFPLHAILSRQLWLMVHPESCLTQLPYGWARNRIGQQTTIPCGHWKQEIADALHRLFAGQTERFVDWLRTNAPTPRTAFDQQAREADLEALPDACKLASLHFSPSR